MQEVKLSSKRVWKDGKVTFISTAFDLENLKKDEKTTISDFLKTCQKRFYRLLESGANQAKWSRYVCPKNYCSTNYQDKCIWHVKGITTYVATNSARIDYVLASPEFTTKRAVKCKVHGETKMIEGKTLFG
ncbi:hypothetical protein OROHE_014507 [Orobanche hederae]